MYEVNEDGSFTELGDVSSLKRPQTQTPEKTPTPTSGTTPLPTAATAQNKKGGCWKVLLWIVVLICVAVGASLFILEAVYPGLIGIM